MLFKYVQKIHIMMIEHKIIEKEQGSHWTLKNTQDVRVTKKFDILSSNLDPAWDVYIYIYITRNKTTTQRYTWVFTVKIGVAC